MKTEFIALSPMGAFSLALAGFMFAQADAVMILWGALCLFVARENARERFESGTYHFGWFMWKKDRTA